MFITARRNAEVLSLELQGEWRATQSGGHRGRTQSHRFQRRAQLRVTVGSSHLDLSGAWLLHDFLERARKARPRSAL